MNLQDLNELDFNNIGVWPGPVKFVLMLIVCALVGVGGYYLDTEKQFKQLERVEMKEVELRRTFQEKQAKAANLDAYKKQLEEMKQSFGAMLRQLPNKTEVAELLVDVSQTGLASGLEFELFKPQGEVPREFYAELPIKLTVTGQYHEFGDFISGLAALPRIVTIHDINISPKKSKRGKSDGLVLQATAKTYRYLDEEGEQ
ncbi:MAG: pilus assembly protein PilO [Gammaproteobacteria bacterium (ex Lamellibrachia satsuma)]|nr:MAG: type 4a pilus biogenesis protein PilO [Gammaproteobacteria bacterium (ex Lamellibrachia satsuma)]RRS33739.1 MAG: pilus assembly protein PilO [Gammaproteobacteria bacterium (ex Lamellibrachia satsuma)]RRS34253.1 MAG: pilus assembly protein PilO [Gammaproteobacteria bacterium (ex Lamellibrachia satsuma)]